MQEKTVKRRHALDYARSSVEAVANDRVVNACQMHPDLVSAASTDPYLEEAETFKLFEYAVFG